MNDWSGVVTDYEKSGLLLCEAYQRLTRAVDFELCVLPACTRTCETFGLLAANQCKMGSKSTRSS